MAGAPLLVRTSNGALRSDAPLVCMEKWKKKLLVAHRVPGAPLVSSTLMAHLHMVRHCYIVVAHHMTGAPLVDIPSIALFLVVEELLSLEGGQGDQSALPPFVLRFPPRIFHPMSS